jgi:hypothetical protein
VRDARVGLETRGNRFPYFGSVNPSNPGVRAGPARRVEIVNGTGETALSLAAASTRAVHGARRASLGKRRARAETGAMEEEKKYIKKKVRSKRVAARFVSRVPSRDGRTTNDATRAFGVDARRSLDRRRDR